MDGRLGGPRGTTDLQGARPPTMSSTATAQAKDRVIIRFAGDSGDGMQMTGDRFTADSAALGNDLSTLPNFPAEIRAPQGTIPGVSSFQLHFASWDILTPGDAPDVLVAMNPAALKANLADVPRGATIIVNTDEFSTRNLKKVGWATSPLDDDTLVLMSTTRYNGGGHDVRMEVMGERGTVTAGLDHSLAMVSAEPDVDFPRGPQVWSFMERFQPAYRAELTAFCEVAAGRLESPCTIADSLEAFRVAEACELSRAQRRAVALTEIRGL